MKQVLCSVLTFILICQLFTGTAYGAPQWPSDTGIQAEGGIIIDMDSGAMIFGQNSKVQYYPASITKLLTALVVIEHSSLEEKVAFSHDAVYNVESGSGNPMGMEEGDQLTVEDCLYLLLLRSSNQAANALAEHVAGSRESFVVMMNERIAELGCSNSHFKNPSGLNDSEQVVTPYDMACIAKAAFSNAKLLEISSAVSHQFPATKNNPDGFKVLLEHKLVITTDSSSDLYFPYAIAGKTGYTSLAGNTLVTYAEKDGRKLIAVVLKGTQPQYYIDSKTLLDFGFKKFKNVNVSEQEKEYTTGENPVVIGDRSFSPDKLVIDSQAVITIPENAVFSDAKKTLVTDLPSDAPEMAVALISYTYNERKIGQAYLMDTDNPVVSESAEAVSEEAQERESEAVSSAQTETGKGGSAETKPAAETASKGFFLDGWFILMLCMLCITGILFSALMIQKKKERKRRQLRRERRRERLKETGCSEEEFEKMLRERLSRKKNLPHEDNIN